MSEEYPIPSLDPRYLYYVNRAPATFASVFREPRQRLQSYFTRPAPYGRDSGGEPLHGPVPFVQFHPRLSTIGQDIFERPLTEEQINFLLDRGFRFDRPVGSGAYGEVWEVWSRKLSRALACKIMMMSKFPKYFSIEQYVQSIKSESDIHSQLKHKNIVRIEDVIHMNDSETGIQCIYSFIFMELCSGNLKQYYSENPNGYLSASEAHRWFVQIVKGLEYLHSNRISHLDIKPVNILYRTDTNGEYVFKLTDFGLSKVFKQNEPHISSDLRGTFAYIPPEVANVSNYFRFVFSYQTDKYETKAFDIYSLGITLAETLMGTSGEASTIVKKCQHWTALTWSQYGIDESLAHLINAMTERDPKLRPTINQVSDHYWVRSYQSYTSVVTEQPKT